ncbi:MAG: hypothetical protein ACP5I4_03025 [Oceanipulchritudo sp.]
MKGTRVDPAVFLTDQACLLRKAPSGENHLLLAFFLRETGLKYALARKATSSGGTPALPDLFEWGELRMEQKDPARPAFLREFMRKRGFPGIARDFRTLRAASRLALFYERNLQHMESFPEAWNLLLTALENLSEKRKPEAVLLKALFLFARNEGYAVRAHWLAQLRKAWRGDVARVLQDPVEACTADPAQLDDWIHDLCRFFAQETDLLPPEK